MSTLQSSEKYESQWLVDYPIYIYPYIMENKNHVPNHQPDGHLFQQKGARRWNPSSTQLSR
jgi:hypothetical protein